MRALVYCNFLREVRLGGWGSEGPKGPTLGQYVDCVRHHSVRKWKYIMRFEIRYSTTFHSTISFKFNLIWLWHQNNPILLNLQLLSKVHVLAPQGAYSAIEVLTDLGKTAASKVTISNLPDLWCTLFCDIYCAPPPSLKFIFWCKLCIPLKWQNKRQKSLIEYILHPKKEPNATSGNLQIYCPPLIKAFWAYMPRVQPVRGGYLNLFWHTCQESNLLEQDI